MALPIRKDRGFTLIEALVVLAIVGILAVVGVTMVGNRQAGSVRALMDELEGGLMNAHKAAVATGRDVAIVTWGTWGGTTPVVMAQGSAALTSAQIQTIALDLLNSIPPSAAWGPNGPTVAVPFHFRPNDPIQTRARVALISEEWTALMLATSSGSQNEDLSTVSPFKTGEILAGALSDTNCLFNPTITTPQQTVISGSNKRFNSTFVIPVVGTSANGGAVPGGAMGLIVVQGNGASIYKFYNPGIKEGDGKWRRI